MVMRLQLVDGEYRIVLPAETVEALQLREGAAVEVQPAPGESTAKYIGVEEGMKLYFDTEPRHRNTYRELAK